MPNAKPVALMTGGAKGIGRGASRRIAETVAWLLDAKRSGFVTGVNSVIDGGIWQHDA